MKVSPGVLCEVVGGLLGEKSPNLGLIVRVTKFVGEHELLGPIWEASSEYGERPDFSVVHRPIIPGHQDYAEDWLRPIPPERIRSPEKEVTA